MQSELSDKEVIGLVKRMKKKGLKIAGYVGGEPMLRKELLEKITSLIPLNVIVTNGTLDCSKFKNTVLIVSVDGTETIHDKVRGVPGLYKKIKKDFWNRDDVYLTTTLTNENKDQIEPLLKDWIGSKIKGMVFDFATPFINEDDSFWISWDERHKILDKLLELKKKYGDFILMSKRNINMLRKEKINAYPKKCACRKFALDFKSDGSLKEKCVLGKKADCSRCGVHIATFPGPLLGLDWESIRIFARMFNGV